MTQTAGEKPGRYQRSMSGMIGALLVTLVVIAAFVGFRALNRDELEIKPEAVDYLSAARQAQSAGIDPVYPASLPEGWIATSVDLRQGGDPAWGVGMLTASGTFVGIRQGGDTLPRLVATYVDEDAVQGDPVTLTGTIADSWQTFGDTGGDRAYAADVGGMPLLVYGSASDDDLRLLLQRLTTDAL